MSAAASRRDGLADLIAEMEPNVRDIIRWGRIVRALGTSDSLPSDTLTVVGDAICEIADSLEADWERCFRLAFAKAEARS